MTDHAGGLRVLVPVDVSEAEAPPLHVLDHLGSVQVVLLGYFPVPDQAEPSFVRDDHEAEAAARLDADDYEVAVIEAADVPAALLEAAAEYDTVCVGLGDAPEGSRLPFGAVTERVAREADSNVVLVRGARGDRNPLANRAGGSGTGGPERLRRPRVSVPGKIVNERPTESPQAERVRSAPALFSE